MATTLFNNYYFKIFFITSIYYITGKLGLLLAIPPGYATVIWPPSGVALGMLVICGYSLWPGIFLGSFLLNCTVSGIYDPEIGFLVSNILSAGGIAVGSTLQAIAGYGLLYHFIGLPLQLNHANQITKVFILAAPVACLIAATIGVSSLYICGLLTQQKIIESWFTWWCGDMFGILIFFPLILILPLRENKSAWRGHLLNTISAIDILMLLMVWGITFYLWKIITVSIYDQGNSKFQALVAEGQQELINEITNYENILLSSEAFYLASPRMNRTIWSKYVQTLSIEEHLIGSKGLGLIIPVTKKKCLSF